MDVNIIEQICSKAMWIPLVSSFVFGVIAKYLFNLFVTPRIEVNVNIIPDYKTKAPYITVRNQSICRWNKAYDIHVYLTYYKNVNGNYEPFHSGRIIDGVIKANSTEKYTIQPKETTIDLEKIDYQIGVILICRNRFSTYSIIEQVCYPDKSAVKNPT